MIQERCRSDNAFSIFVIINLCAVSRMEKDGGEGCADIQGV